MGCNRLEIATAASHGRTEVRIEANDPIPWAPPTIVGIGTVGAWAEGGCGSGNATGGIHRSRRRC